jgi:hypothetical protein
MELFLTFKTNIADDSSHVSIEIRGYGYIYHHGFIPISLSQIPFTLQVAESPLMMIQ